MKDKFSNNENQDLEDLDKEFVTKIAKEIYSLYVNNEIDLTTQNEFDSTDDEQEVGIQFSFFADEEDGSFGISINEDEMYIDEYENDTWIDATDYYDSFAIKVQIENEIEKLVEKKAFHKKDKEVIKHMKSDIDL